MTTAKDYGASAVELETLRRLVDERAIAGVYFGGFTPSGAANGEYSFRLPSGISAWVRAPTAPKGGLRYVHPGQWLFRLTNRPRDEWQHAGSVHIVVDWYREAGGGIVTVLNVGSVSVDSQGSNRSSTANH